MGMSFNCRSAHSTARPAGTQCKHKLKLMIVVMKEHEIEISDVFVRVLNNINTSITAAEGKPFA